MNITQTMAAQVGEVLARKRDEALHEALNQRLGQTGWTRESLRGRLTIVNPPDRLYEFYCLDGKPILRVGKLHFSDKPGEIGAWRTIEQIADEASLEQVTATVCRGPSLSEQVDDTANWTFERTPPATP